MRYILLAFFFISSVTYGQKLKKADRAILNNFKTTVTHLADDKYEGRRTGTLGEKLAAEFISGEFKKVGLAPKGDANSYLQAFEINEGKEILPSTYLVINGDSLKTGSDFFPLIFSANGTVNAFASPAIHESNTPWFLDINDLIEKNAGNPHYDLLDGIKNSAVEYMAKGANALIVYNSGNTDAGIKFDGKSKIAAIKIPVIFIDKKIAAKYLEEKTADLEIKLATAIGDKKRNGSNVVGFIDNNAANTIVLGAHYDHLGYGEDHNSLWTGGAQIHNGADDNASGVATILELAKMLKNSKLKNNNYLFIAFSGEELGLFGSKYFTENATIPVERINYMINCDMVGRLNEQTKSITVGGYGTSPIWGQILPEKTKTLNVKFDSSGMGPSDHTSFYIKNIPVLFFFTGTHQDYHKPSDDADKINHTGGLHIIKYIYDVVKNTNDQQKLAFAKTREPQMTGARFTVSLGVMPDYTFSGTGLKIDGVIDGRVADKAGLKTGDVVTQIGDFNITDINAYMTALSKYKKGDSAKIKAQRGTEIIEVDIVF